MKRRANDNRSFVCPVGVGACFDDAGRFGFIVPNRKYLPDELDTLAELLSCLAGGCDCGDLFELASDMFDGDPKAGRSQFVFIRGWTATPEGPACPTFGTVPLDEV